MHQVGFFQCLLTLICIFWTNGMKLDLTPYLDCLNLSDSEENTGKRVKNKCPYGSGLKKGKSGQNGQNGKRGKVDDSLQKNMRWKFQLAMPSPGQSRPTSSNKNRRNTQTKTQNDFNQSNWRNQQTQFPVENASNSNNQILMVPESIVWGFGNDAREKKTDQKEPLKSQSQSSLVAHSKEFPRVENDSREMGDFEFKMDKTEQDKTKSEENLVFLFYCINYPIK